MSNTPRPHAQNKAAMQVWDLIVSLFTVFVTIEIPVRLAFGLKSHGFMLVLDWLITVIFIRRFDPSYEELQKTVAPRRYPPGNSGLHPPLGSTIPAFSTSQIASHRGTHEEMAAL